MLKAGGNMCFTLEIQFQIFSAVTLAISSNTFMQLNIFLSFATFLTFKKAPKKDVVYECR